MNHVPATHRSQHLAYPQSVALGQDCIVVQTLDYSITVIGIAALLKQGMFGYFGFQKRIRPLVDTTTGKHAQVIQINSGRGTQAIYCFNIGITGKQEIAQLLALTKLVVFSLAGSGKHQCRQKE